METTTDVIAALHRELARLSPSPAWPHLPGLGKPGPKRVRVRSRYYEVQTTLDYLPGGGEGRGWDRHMDDWLAAEVRCRTDGVVAHRLVGVPASRLWDWWGRVAANVERELDAAMVDAAIRVVLGEEGD